MTMMLQSFAAGNWVAPGDAARAIHSAVTGEEIARAGGAPLDMTGMLDHARNVGGPALRAMGFHDRSRLLKQMALALMERKEELYALSTMTGATRADSWVDIEGGIGTCLAMASKARREMPDGQVYLDGGAEMLSRGGTFQGQQICTLQMLIFHVAFQIIYQTIGNPFVRSPGRSFHPIGVKIRLRICKDEFRHSQGICQPEKGPNISRAVNTIADQFKRVGRKPPLYLFMT